jgi:hypothetical protein
MTTRNARWVVILIAVMFCHSAAVHADGVTSVDPTTNVDPLRQLDAKDVESISELIRHIVLNNLPHQYEERDDWGRTKEVWAGLKISLDGLRVKTKRRKKDVNHGSWKIYRVWLANPQRDFDVQLRNLRTVPGTGVGFDLVVDSRLGTSARWSEWQRGVQLYSVSAEADAKVRLTMRCELGLAFELTDFPPDMILEPSVTDANLQLLELRVHRVSKLSGPLVKQLGRALRDVLQQELDRRRTKLVTKINDEIQDNREALKISLRDLPGRGFDAIWKRVFPDKPSAST